MNEKIKKKGFFFIYFFMNQPNDAGSKRLPYGHFFSKPRCIRWNYILWEDLSHAQQHEYDQWKIDKKEDWSKILRNMKFSM